MKTYDLILLLVQDAPVRVSLDQALVHATIAATLIAGVAFFELTTMFSSTWETRMVGHNARLFLTIIPSLSAAPLARLPYAMRQGAPLRPALAREVAGWLPLALPRRSMQQGALLIAYTWRPIS
ncbi:NrsF family protein [Rhizobium ruizarguesonis]|jgi:hypothetical protein|uniref:NrsF family protein n=1 Tax=Rhizobium ruizarguesonis TaxID=2081791 RepID=UPI001FDF3D5B|nr:NrsF family protein [Rhizobium ruizarguesonis]